MPETKVSETKISKLLACNPEGEPYALIAKTPETKTGQGYRLVFENGDQAILMSHIPEANGPSSNGFKIVVGTEYKYTLFLSKRGTQMVDVLCATTPKEIANTMPGVTTADAVPAKEEKASPQLTTPTRTFAEAAAATKKATREELTADSNSLIPSIPDNKPRLGTVQLLRHNIETFDQGKTTKVKWLVTMTDGAKGVMWSDAPEQQPVIVGQTYNYVFDKAYADSKRIAIVPMDSQVDRETMIMRMGCLNSAIAYFALPAEEGAITQTKDVLRVASDFEVHVTRSID